MRRPVGTTLISLAFACTPLLVSCIAAEPTSVDPSGPTVVCSGGRWRCFASGCRPRRSGSRRIAVGAGLRSLGSGESPYNLDALGAPGATIAIVDAYDYANAGERPRDVPQRSTACRRARPSNGASRSSTRTARPRRCRATAPSNDDWTVETALDSTWRAPRARSARSSCRGGRRSGRWPVHREQHRGAAARDRDQQQLGRPRERRRVRLRVVLRSRRDRRSSSRPATAATTTAGRARTTRRPRRTSIGVGGTTLSQGVGSRGWTESAWSGGGSSCSLVIAKPRVADQHARAACARPPTCPRSAIRTTGLAVYNSANGGWIASAARARATPFVAGIFALTHHGNWTAHDIYTPRGRLLRCHAPARTARAAATCARRARAGTARRATARRTARSWRRTASARARVGLGLGLGLGVG